MKVTNLLVGLAVAGAYVGAEQSVASLAEMFADNGRASNDQSQQMLFAERANMAECIAEWMIPFHQTSLELNAKTGYYEVQNSVSWPFDYAFE